MDAEDLPKGLIMESWIVAHFPSPLDSIDYDNFKFWNVLMLQDPTRVQGSSGIFGVMIVVCSVMRCDMIRSFVQNQFNALQLQMNNA